MNLVIPQRKLTRDIFTEIYISRFCPFLPGRVSPGQRWFSKRNRRSRTISSSLGIFYGKRTVSRQQSATIEPILLAISAGSRRNRDRRDLRREATEETRERKRNLKKELNFPSLERIRYVTYWRGDSNFLKTQTCKI